MSSLKQFEGWYYRVTEPDSDESWVIIAAYWQDQAGDPRAFIELIQASTGATYKQVYEDFNIEGKPLIFFEFTSTFSLHAFHFSAACLNRLGWCGKSNSRSPFF